MKIRLALAAVALGAWGLAACDDPTPPVRSRAPTKIEPAKSTPPGPRIVLELDVSAYRARLDFDGDTLVLATPRGLHLAPSGAAVTAIAHEFGNTFALSGSKVVYFRDGRLWESRRGALPTALGAVAREPSALALDHEHLTWLEREPSGPSFIQTFAAGKVRQLARITGRVDTLGFFENWVFFFEQGPGGTWRLGGVSLDGGTPKFTQFRAGRVPSTLEAAGELFFYDGPSRSVRRISPDLEREEVVGNGVICSPLAVGDRVVCAQVGGLYELPLGGGAPERLAAQTSFVTALATKDRRVAWISDSGADRLYVKVLDLPPPR